MLKRKHYTEKKVKKKQVTITSDFEENLQHPSTKKYKRRGRRKPQEIKTSIYFLYSGVSSFLTLSEVICSFNSRNQVMDMEKHS